MAGKPFVVAGTALMKLEKRIVIPLALREL